MDLFISYLDPGTGSVIIQAVIGAVAGIGIFGRKAINGFRYKLMNPNSQGKVSKKTNK